MSAIQHVEGGAEPEWDLTDRLVKARKYASLEQADIAQYLGLSPRAVSTFETGKIIPRLAYLRGWAERCGVSLHWLAGPQIPFGLPPNAPGDQDFRTPG